MSTERDPSTDQPPPVPAPADVDGAHVAAMRSINARRARFEPAPAITAAVDLLAERYRLGLTKYGTVLHAGNGRDHRRDLLEELADAVAYAHALGDEGLIKLTELTLLVALTPTEER